LIHPTTALSLKLACYMLFTKGAKWKQIYFLQFLFFWVINPVPKFIEKK